MGLTIREYVFVPPTWADPGDETVEDGSPLGLLLCEQEGGEQVTVMVDGEYLRMMLAAPDAARRGLQIEPHRVMPGYVEGWLDDWTAATAAMVNSVRDMLYGGQSWEAVREHVTSSQ